LARLVERRGRRSGSRTRPLSVGAV
jgi:hypothetical protein